MERGETVLFVAEKLAALEVVQKRLNDAGLGDFVLELHSHKTRKLAVLEEIKRRRERTYPAVRQFASEMEKLAEARATLSAHATAVGEPIGGLDWPVSRVLFEAGAARLRRLGAGASLTFVLIQPISSTSPSWSTIVHSPDWKLSRAS
ncbi:MAG: hypothetical protein AcusKO_45280 [Acuticoccus sp.]